MSSPPFLLIPGLNCTAEIFAPLIPVLGPFGPVMVANHTQGTGVREIAANILRTAPPRFALAGFSLGGYLAFEIIRQAGARVGKLALIDTSARPDTAEASARRRTGIEAVRDGAFEATVMAGFPMAVHQAHLERTDLQQLLWRMAETFGPEAYIRHQETIIARPDSGPDLGSIKLNTLVVVGDADQTTVPAAAREMATGIAGARLAVIPDAGHMALVEQPDAVNAVVREWAAD